MSKDNNPYLISIKEFVASKQIRLFQGLKQDCFSGQLVIQDTQSKKWTFFLYLGRIVYVIGGVHGSRRWRRNLVAYLPKIAYQLEKELQSIDNLTRDNTEISWDYSLLSLWVEAEKANREDVTKMIRAIATEVLFDITQAREITYYLKPQDKYISSPLAMIDSEQQIIEAWKLWQSWQEANLEDYSPNLAPAIKQPDRLKERTSPKIYQALTRLLNGKSTLRDLAVQKQKSVLMTASSIMPYLKLGFLELTEIPDINTPIAINTTQKASIPSKIEEYSLSSAQIDKENTELSSSIPRTKPLIACIDESPSFCQNMGDVITQAGYAFKAEQDPLKAIAVLLDIKPDLIFIDLLMPELNGYELCSQLRQLTYFQNTPIILLVSNINLIDRVKAKMIGCSELFDKSSETKSVLNIIARYLNQQVVNS